MKEDEKIAYQYFLSIGYFDDDILPEPIKNSTPDFLIKNHIAIEVRRLNQNYGLASGHEGIEHINFRMKNNILSIADKFGQPTKTNGYYLDFSFKRNKQFSQKELNIWIKKAQNWLHFLLKEIQNNSLQKGKFLFDPYFHVTLAEADHKLTKLFFVRGGGNCDHGGFIFDLMKENIKICIDEKSKKISKIYEKYPTWRLILISKISFGFPAEYISDLRADIKKPDLFEKITIVYENDFSLSFDL